MPVTKQISTTSRTARGQGRLGLLHYMIDPARHAGETMEFLTGNVASQNPDGIDAEMRALADSFGKSGGRTYHHFVVSYDPTDTSTLEQRIQHLNRLMLENKELNRSQWTAAYHTDKAHGHWHICCNSVGLDGIKIRTNRLQTAIAADSDRIALELGKIKVLPPASGSAAAMSPRLSEPERKLKSEHGIDPSIIELSGRIDAVLRTEPTSLEQYRDRLDGVDVDVYLSNARGGLTYHSKDLDFQSNAGKIGKLAQLSGIMEVIEHGYDSGTKTVANRVFKPSERNSAHSARAAAAFDGIAELDRTGTNPGADRAAVEQVGLDIASAGAHRAELVSPADGAGRRDGGTENAEIGLAGDAAPAFEHGPAHTLNIDIGDDRRPSGSGFEGGNTAHQAVTGHNHQSDSDHLQPRAGTSKIRDLLRQRNGIIAKKPEGIDMGTRNQRNAGPSAGRNSNSWDSRFKIASAAKRRASERGANTGRSELAAFPAAAAVFTAAREKRSVPQAALDLLKQIDLPDFAAARYGWEIKRVGKEWGSTTDHRFWHDGQKWAWRMGHQDTGGDILSLIRNIEDVGFIEAVYIAQGQSMPTRLSAAVVPPVKKHVLHVPERTPDMLEAVERYIKGRGIDQKTIDHAVRVGVLSWCADGPVFVGCDETGKAKSATIRYLQPRKDAEGREYAKRDLSGSDKSRPAIIPGDPRRIVVVEGGFDGLSAWQMFDRPTIIISGGIGVRKWIDTPHVRAMLEQAEQIDVYKDNDPKPETRQQVEKDARRLVEDLCKINPKAVLCDPGAGHKDLNARLVAELAAKQPDPAKEAAAYRVAKDGDDFDY